MSRNGQVREILKKTASEPSGDHFYNRSMAILPIWIVNYPANR